METTAPATRTPPVRWARVALILVPAILIIGLLSWATLQRGSAPQAGDAAPAFAGPRLEGDGSLSLADFEGRPLVLNFWASWCAPCEDEAPILNRAANRYEGEVAFLGVNIKDARPDALAFERQFDVAYPSIRDETQQIYEDYALTGQPETFLIGANGTIVERIPGAIPTETFFTRRLEALLARSAAPNDAGG